MNLEARMLIERKIVRKLIRVMKVNGWYVDSVDNGGDGREKCVTERDVMNMVFACDDATIYFEDNFNNHHHWVYIVLGNDGYDCICDYSFCADNGDNFDLIMHRDIDPYCDSFDC